MQGSFEKENEQPTENIPPRLSQPEILKYLREWLGSLRGIMHQFSGVE